MTQNEKAAVGAAAGREMTSYSHYRKWRRREPSVRISLDELDRRMPDTPVILWARVSSRAQAEAGDLRDQEQALKAEAERHGHPVAAVFACVRRGTEARNEVMAQAARLSRQTGFPILTKDTTRIVRHPDYRPDLNQFPLPSQGALNFAMRLYYGTIYASVVPPTADDKEIRALRTQWGQEAKGNTGGGYHGRGWKALRRKKLRPEVLRLRAAGKSYRQIAEELEIPYRTIARWREE
jgi:hypothetical protein